MRTISLTLLILHASFIAGAYGAFNPTPLTCGAAVSSTVKKPFDSAQTIQDFFACMKAGYRNVAMSCDTEYTNLDADTKQEMLGRGIRIITHTTYRFGANAIMFTREGTKNALLLFLGLFIKEGGIPGHDYTIGKLFGYDDADIEYYFKTRSATYKEPGCGPFEIEKKEGDAWIEAMGLFIDQLELA